ncbi:hypothetical protein EAI_15464 [Harpegnathos saltator]|uniref:Uncharacterized protein n=1 Tax=Harpegnathos saltator TaxID=610380 RepID=E2BC42_HARSA|nr:hypothetical protein EAI_00146 [Harpegnathos saltator]EFN86718.1 hypothetical protein EAI_15464 [Harpegnathos saltator]
MQNSSAVENLEKLVIVDEYIFEVVGYFGNLQATLKRMACYQNLMVTRKVIMILILKIKDFEYLKYKTILGVL